MHSVFSVHPSSACCVDKPALFTRTSICCAHYHTRYNCRTTSARHPSAQASTVPCGVVGVVVLERHVQEPIATAVTVATSPRRSFAIPLFPPKAQRSVVLRLSVSVGKTATTIRIHDKHGVILQYPTRDTTRDRFRPSRRAPQLESKTPSEASLHTYHSGLLVKRGDKKRGGEGATPHYYTRTIPQRAPRVSQGPPCAAFHPSVVPPFGEFPFIAQTFT